MTNEETIEALANNLKKIFTPKEFIKVKDGMLSILAARMPKPEPKPELKRELSDEEAKLLQRRANLVDDANQLKADKDQTIARLEALKREQHEREYQLTVIDDRLNDIGLELQAIHIEWVKKHHAVHVEPAKPMPSKKKTPRPCFDIIHNAIRNNYGIYGCNGYDKSIKSIRNMVYTATCKHINAYGYKLAINDILDICKAQHCEKAGAEYKSLYDEHRKAYGVQLELSL